MVFDGYYLGFFGYNLGQVVTGCVVGICWRQLFFQRPTNQLEAIERKERFVPPTIIHKPKMDAPIMQADPMSVNHMESLAEQLTSQLWKLPNFVKGKVGKQTSITGFTVYVYIYIYI